MNWRLGKPRILGGGPPSLPWRKIDFGSRMMERSMYQVPNLLEAKYWGNFQPLGEVDPYLVLPGY